MSALLDIVGLYVSYGPVAAVRGISLSVQPGQIVALLGGNGAGKTSSLKAITGLEKVSAGEIYFDGTRIDTMPTQRIVRGGIAMSPEGRRVFPNMSVHENLVVGAHSRNDGAQNAEMLARIYGWFPRLLERKNQLAGLLSGGEQQMLAIGRALMARPRVLLLDEPSLGLAPMMVTEIARIVREIRDVQGLAVLIVEQNALVALKLCDYAHVLENGEIRLSGTGEELLSNEGVQKAYIGF
ncbi:MAG: ABC transporter ATP-binding protein [Xanthobacteraceae bacterium]|nr:ABC transporter ATP-binding protein [Xanthobacteraceae bacterium]